MQREHLLSRAWIAASDDRLTVAHVFRAFDLFGDVDFAEVASGVRKTAAGQYFRKTLKMRFERIAAEAEDIAAASFDVETETRAASGATAGNFAAALFLVSKNTAIPPGELLALPYSQFLQLLHAAVCASGLRCSWKYYDGSAKKSFADALQILKRQKKS